MGEKSKLRRSISRWANADDQHARELRETTRAGRCDLIADCDDRKPVRLRGTLRTVTLRPRGGVPALEAELFDGSGSLTLVWLGRREIAAVSPGRSVEVQGRIGRHGGERIIYNPRYTLLP
ncbi:MAG: OB-fold nucleic acid binding domain-containing protein [Nocardioides sp.]|nr:OB-fold nucleic acid binding domain-containing protein [Nocardioides sp.]